MAIEKLGGKRVLVTGGFGYVGSQVLAALEAAGIEHLSIDKKHKKTAKALTVDLCGKESVAAITKFKPDFLVHCGTYSAQAYKTSFFESFKEDFASACNILEALSKLPGCRLVCFSSTYVYSGLAGKVTESTPLKPAHNFGVAKSFFEQFFIRNPPNTVFFRLSSVFGPGNALNPNAILGMAQECISTSKLTVWGSGKRMMQYVYMTDVVNKVLASYSIPPGIYNLGSDEYVSVAEAAKKIADFFKVKVALLKDKPEGETLPFMDCSLLKQATGLGFTPFKKALPEYLSSIHN